MPSRYPVTKDKMEADNYSRSLARNTASRFMWTGFFTAAPPNPAVGCSDAYILDTGATVQFVVRHNDNGTIKTGAINLV